MSSPTHHWIKRLAEIRKPAYLAIPDLIEEDLATGRLRPRDRMPGLRDLADELSLNYTTVARAYAEAQEARPARFARRQRHLRARPHRDAAALRRQQHRNDR